MKMYTIALGTALAAIATTGVFAQTSIFSDKDKDFLKTSAQDDYAEIKTAELALTKLKGVSTPEAPALRAFAQKMISDHKMLLMGEKPVAAKAGVSLPDGPGVENDATYLKLKTLSGDEFVKSYVNSADSDHHKDATASDDEYNSTQNPEMKALAKKAGTVIESHVKMIDGIKGKMNTQ